MTDSRKPFQGRPLSRDYRLPVARQREQPELGCHQPVHVKGQEEEERGDVFAFKAISVLLSTCCRDTSPSHPQLSSSLAPGDKRTGAYDIGHQIY